MIISYDMYDIYMIYQPFEQQESLYLESKLITSKHFIGTYCSHMVSISDMLSVRRYCGVENQLNTKQVAGAGFRGPLLNLKWLPCD